jgi:hypothetical protein
MEQQHKWKRPRANSEGKQWDGRKGRSGRVKGEAAGGVVEWTSLGLVVVSFPNLIPLNETALLLAAGCWLWAAVCGHCAGRRCVQSGKPGGAALQASATHNDWRGPRLTKRSVQY